jgi:hypothetical protein
MAILDEERVEAGICISTGFRVAEICYFSIMAHQTRGKRVIFY